VKQGTPLELRDLSISISLNSDSAIIRMSTSCVCTRSVIGVNNGRLPMFQNRNLIIMDSLYQLTSNHSCLHIFTSQIKLLNAAYIFYRLYWFTPILKQKHLVPASRRESHQGCSHLCGQRISEKKGVVKVKFTPRDNSPLSHGVSPTLPAIRARWARHSCDQVSIESLTSRSSAGLIKAICVITCSRLPTFGESKIQW